MKQEHKYKIKALIDNLVMVIAVSNVSNLFLTSFPSIANRWLMTSCCVEPGELSVTNFSIRYGSNFSTANDTNEIATTLKTM
jgi:hypothetical protein